MVKHDCEKFEKVLPYFTNDKKVLIKLINDPILEPIITGIVIPYLNNIDENREQVKNCERCYKFYNSFLTKKSIETMESLFDLDNERLYLWS